MQFNLRNCKLDGKEGIAYAKKCQMFYRLYLENSLSFSSKGIKLSFLNIKCFLNIKKNHATYFKQTQNN